MPGREQLTRLRRGQPPLPRAAGAGRPARLEPVTRRSPFPRSPPFISPRLAPTRSPGPSTAFSAPPPAPPSHWDPAIRPRGCKRPGRCSALHSLQRVPSPWSSGRAPAAAPRRVRASATRIRGVGNLGRCKLRPKGNSRVSHLFA